MRYHYTARVKRTVIDTVSLSLDTDGGDSEARKKAIETLSNFPGPNLVDYVPYCYIENREQVEADVLDLERMVPKDARA